MAKDNGENNQFFVNIRLEKQDKAAIRALAENSTAQQLVDELVMLLDEGYAVSLSPDVAHDSIVVTLVGKECIDENRDRGMSQRHVDPIVACWAVIFAHKELAEGGAWGKRAYDWRDAEW